MLASLAEVLKFATDLVETEDNNAKRSRIMRYEQEINEQLGLIQKAEERGLREIELTFSNRDVPEKIQRISSALRKFGYTCANPQGRQGGWDNSCGNYHRYQSMKVSW
jgi:hypothetical protein